MTLERYREKMAKFIIVTHLSIFALILILFALGGFTPEELGDVFKFLLPIKTIYVSALVNYVVVNKVKKNIPEEESESSNNILTQLFTSNKKKNIQEEKKKSNDQITDLFKNVTTFLVYGHISLLASCIILDAFNLMSRENTSIALAIIESIFGGTVLIIISDLFKSKTEE